jgi:hypothetical protein
MRVAKAWVTKYALTTGIVAIEGEVYENRPRQLLRIKKSGGPPEFYHKPYWHEHRADALRHAEELRRKKIAALEKQIDRLLKLRFK